MHPKLLATYASPSKRLQEASLALLRGEHAAWYTCNLLTRQGQFFENNLANANALRAFAEKKGITPAQLAIGWVASLGPHVLPLPGSSYVLPAECFMW